MPAIVVPQGKTLSLYRGRNPITNVPLILEEDITLSLSSSFRPLVSGGNIKIDIAGGIAADIFGEEFGFSSQFKEFGYQVWERTDPLSFNATVTFHMGMLGEWNGRTEVYSPAIALSKLPLPTIGQAVLNNSIENLKSPGPPATSLLEVGYGGNYVPISLQIANIIYISHIVVLKAEPTFSNETDENGNPVWASVNLDIQSVETATAEMLETQTEDDV